MPLKTIVRFFLCGAVAAATGGADSAQQPAPADSRLNVELNAVAPSTRGCMMTFVAENDMATPIAKISFELAFFNDKNTVDKITVVDFRDLPIGKKRVRQFDMPNIKCEALTRVIVNDVPVCDGPAAGECKAALTTRSQIAVPFEG